MGAQDFITRARGKTAREAFFSAVTEAKYFHGHGGYSGSIAEKYSFKVVKRPEGIALSTFVSDCLEDGEHFCQDKWGAAACVQGDKPDEWVFFGCASS